MTAASVWDMNPLRLYRYDDLLSRGMSARRRTALIRAKRLVSVRPGFFADGTEWTAASPEERLVATARALDLMSTTRPVVSHETAAAVHGLPLFRPNDGTVHAIVAAERPGAARGVVRHRGDLSDDEVIEVNGLLCTNLARTVADVARTMTFEQAVTVADAALRRTCVPRAGVYLTDRHTDFRKTVAEIARRSAHGVARARRVLAFADGRAQLPGESISRIRLYELGFRGLDLQVRVPGPKGTNFYVDFGFEEQTAFGEFDGTMKYNDGRLVDGRTTAAIFDAEKQREDWIRGTTNRRIARWGWPHIKTATALRSRLTAFGVVPTT
ncbi:hypothetical protein ASD65_16985 [Microbacterium sp. Root61]|uniref:hypothetical protein n=1 Tax=Microbacterium sp. Root61 TaxID=1736570 RepID=UPI0006FAC3F7|nr:hypothetical protein [Microbacterium sp. Root61]KRA22202.1 hypothetical protein ASD65_16985 [Microbacterium sp. Root61]